MTMYTFTPAELLLLLAMDGFQLQHPVYVDPVLLRAVQPAALRQAQKTVTERGWVLNRPDGTAALRADIRRLTRGLLAPKACLALERPTPTETEQTLFLTFTPTETIVSQVTDQQTYVLETLPVALDQLVDRLLAYCGATDVDDPTRIYDVRHFDVAGFAAEAATPADAPEAAEQAGLVLAALAEAAHSAGLPGADRMLEDMTAGRMMTLRSIKPQAAPGLVNTLTWAEKPGVRWALGGPEGGPEVAVMRLNGPVLKEVTKVWLTELTTEPGLN